MLSSLDVYYSGISDVRAVASRTGKKYRSLLFLIFNLRDVNIAGSLPGSTSESGAKNSSLQLSPG